MTKSIHLPKSLLTALLLMATCPVPLIASAAEANATASMPGPGAGGLPSPDEVVSRLDSKLSLTDDQKAAIKPIIADRQDKLRALLADGSGPMQHRRELRSIVKDSDSKINALLTSTQQKQYAEVEKEMRAQMRERMQQMRGGAQ
jgi:Spy/CpxP family protein refolding chaperone